MLTVALGVILTLSACSVGPTPVDGPPASPLTPATVSASQDGDAESTERPPDAPATATQQETGGESSALPAEGEPAGTGSDDGEVAGGAAVDYSNDAGESLREYDYPDDPEPADTIVATLCNLDQRFFQGLRTVENGSPVADDSLRMSVLAVSDLLETWESLRPHYPDAVPAIDTAQAVRDTWDEALLSLENGERGPAVDLMVTAEALIAELPESAGAGCATGDVG